MIPESLIVPAVIGVALVFMAVLGGTAWFTRG
jgi:hypothetical protein